MIANTTQTSFLKYLLLYISIFMLTTSKCYLKAPSKNMKQFDTFPQTKRIGISLNHNSGDEGYDAKIQQ